MISCVYSITNIANNKKYIGSTKDFDKRKSQHLYNLRNNIHINIYLQRSFNKYGESSFIFDIVETVYDISNLLNREDFYINALNVRNYTYGYNLANASGGDTISIHPNNAMIREKISKSIKTRWINMTEIERSKWIQLHSGCNNGMFGKHHSDKTKEILKTKLTGRKLSEITKHNMKQSFTTERRSNLSELAKTKIGALNPFYGKTHSDDIKAIISEKNKARNFIPPNKKPFTIDGIYYDSLMDASHKLNISTTVIRWRILSKNPKYTTYKYINIV